MNTPKSSKKQQTSSPKANTSTSVTPQVATPSGKKAKRQSATTPAAKKQQSPSHMDFLSFQPALASCFITPPSQKDANNRRSSPRGNNAKYSSQANGFNNSLSPIKLSSPAIAPILKQSQPRRQQQPGQSRGSPPGMFKQTPFAGAKYLEMPSNKDLPQPPAWLIAADFGSTPPPMTTRASATTIVSEIEDSDTSMGSSPISMIEPPSPTTAAAIKVAKENGFDGSVRIHPLQLIAAVCSS